MVVRQRQDSGHHLSSLISNYIRTANSYKYTYYDDYLQVLPTPTSLGHALKALRAAVNTDSDWLLAIAAASTQAGYALIRAHRPFGNPIHGGVEQAWDFAWQKAA